ncbi:hypothetical protein [Eshraghiella crossota]|uniref:hypothetical protein n=1 Tax=Eshraghiella crossota TaxID=45851 RepID=UPI003AB30CEC
MISADFQSVPIITGEATLPLRWLPPATPLWTCRPGTPCAVSFLPVFTNTMFQKSACADIIKEIADYALKAAPQWFVAAIPACVGRNKTPYLL